LSLSCSERRRFGVASADVKAEGGSAPEGAPPPSRAAVEGEEVGFSRVILPDAGTATAERARRVAGAGSTAGSRRAAPPSAITPHAVVLGAVLVLALVVGHCL